MEPSSGTPQGIVIRGYEARDQAGFERLVTSVHREFGFEYDAALDADLSDPTAFYIKTWVLAEVDGSIAGTVALREAADGVELKRMYLKPGLRGRGHGRSLLETATSWAQDAGYKYVELDTAEHQTDAQRLYERAGFEFVGHADRPGAPGMRYYRLTLEPSSR